MSSQPVKREPERAPVALVARHLPFVRRVARRLARRLPAHVRFEDLVSAGVVGLLEAMGRFDPGRERDFESYAEFRVKGAILDELRRRDLMARDARLAAKEIESCISNLTHRLGRPPEEHETAAALGLDVDELRERLERLTPVRVVSVDDLRGGGLAAAAGSPLDEAMREELHAQLETAITRLSDRQQQVLALYYQEELTLREIGEVFGVSESRICQVLAEATMCLRALLGVEGRRARRRGVGLGGEHG